jgi:hypothetical protein
MIFALPFVNGAVHEPLTRFVDNPSRKERIPSPDKSKTDELNR